METAWTVFVTLLAMVAMAVRAGTAVMRAGEDKEVGVATAAAVAMAMAATAVMVVTGATVATAAMVGVAKREVWPVRMGPMGPRARTEKMAKLVETAGTGKMASPVFELRLQSPAGEIGAKRRHALRGG